MKRFLLILLLIPAIANAQIVLRNDNNADVSGADLRSGSINVDSAGRVKVAAGDLNMGNVDIASIAAGDNNVGNVDVASVAIPAGPSHGQKTVTTAGTEVVLGTGALISGVMIKALHGNTGWIYVGGNPVTLSTGFVLDAGEQVFIECDNLSDVYIDSSVNGEGVSYIGG